MSAPDPTGAPHGAPAPDPSGPARGPVRIANCSGFYGDRLAAAREMVEGGPIDVLTGDWLAELTMLILARRRAKRPGGGYARSFVTQMEQVMGTCLDRGIKVVSNAGGLDPGGCAEAVAEVADRLGLSPTIAYVEGDDLLPRLDELLAAGVDLAHAETGEPLGDPSRLISANAYLGCWGIVAALDLGADIVVTGRTTDAAVACGPAAWYHGWARDDWDALAGAVVAGHVIECGPQATGGNYSFFTEVPGMARTGFPWAEVAADGSSVIGKHEGTGGEVSIGTVTSQLLYEIDGPAYLGPDVTARFDTVLLEEVGADRVRIHGTRGEPPPPTLKVAMNELGGFRNDIGVALTGLDIEAKAELVEEAFWEACPYRPEDFAAVATHLARTDKPDPASNEEAVAVWQLTVKDPDERKVGRAVSSAMVELGLATIPGFFGVSGGPGEGRPYGVYRPALVPADLVPQHVVTLGGERTVVESVAPAGGVTVTPAPGPAAEAPRGPTVAAPIGRVVGARSGDKGGNANLGVFARGDAAWAWLDGFLTVDRLRALLPETSHLAVDRYRLPALRSLNFVIHGLLQEGVAASTRQDRQAKSLGEWLRARVVDVPAALLPGDEGALVLPRDPRPT
ncbi:MAG TPA: acyclic terpene utilization AtuA family protein [Acidimicrobiales bacterium]